MAYSASRWFFCMRGPEYALMVDIAIKGAVSPVAVYLQSAYDALWFISGGTPGDAEYEAWLQSFEITVTSLNEDEPQMEKLYTVSQRVTQAFYSASQLTDTSKRVCPLLPVGGLTFPNSN